jgi:methionyl-tRNA formyltransferase
VIRRLLLLTGSFEAQLLLPHLSRSAAGVDIQHIDGRERLASVFDQDAAGTRLLCFCTAVIVPSAVLDRLPGPSYNIHPGPPSYPGRHPESWGAYDGVERFGATLHEMVPRVDEGPIVDVEWTDDVAGASQTQLGLHAFRAALRLLARWAPRLVGDMVPLPHSSHGWSGRKTTHAQLEAMCRITPDIDAAEFERRRRAFAEPPGSRMTLAIHGCEFHFVTPAQAEEASVKEAAPAQAAAVNRPGD